MWCGGVVWCSVVLCGEVWRGVVDFSNGCGGFKIFIRDYGVLWWFYGSSLGVSGCFLQLHPSFLEHPKHNPLPQNTPCSPSYPFPQNPPTPLKVAILRMDEMVLTKESIEKILKSLLPTKEEITKINNAQLNNNGCWRIYLLYCFC